MNGFPWKALLVLLPIALTACDNRAPTHASSVTPPSAAPQPTAPSRPIAAFDVAGVVLNEQGRPMAGAVVTMASWLGDHTQWPSATTDAKGSYAMSFTASTLGSGFVARAQVVADGYEEYWRNISSLTGTTTFIQNFRLDRIVRVTAGDSVVLNVPTDVGECRGWVAPVCPVVRVKVPTQGRLTVVVEPIAQSGALPPVEVCCANGDEQYGNPIALPASAGSELEVRVGLQPGFAAPLSFLVKTSMEP